MKVRLLIGMCKPYCRPYVNSDESDELGTFIFRNTGFNCIRTLPARLCYYHALLSCLPLQLTLRGKSSTQSYRNSIYYVDLILCDGQSARSDSQYKANQCTKQGRMVPSGGVRTCGGAMLLQFQFCSGE